MKYLRNSHWDRNLLYRLGLGFDTLVSNSLLFARRCTFRELYAPRRETNFVFTINTLLRITFRKLYAPALPPIFLLRSFVFALPLIFCILPLLLCATEHKILLVPPISRSAITSLAPPDQLFPQCESLVLLCSLSLLFTRNTSVSFFLHLRCCH